MVTYNQPGVQYNEGRYNAETVSGVADAVLGGVVAVATGTVTPAPVPPAPSQVGGGRYPYAVGRQRKQVDESVVEVSVAGIVDGFCVPVRVVFGAFADGGVTFSGEDDDLQVLLML